MLFHSHVWPEKWKLLLWYGKNAKHRLLKLLLIWFTIVFLVSLISKCPIYSTSRLFAYLTSLCRKDSIFYANRYMTSIKLSFSKKKKIHDIHVLNRQKSHAKKAQAYTCWPMPIRENTPILCLVGSFFISKNKQIFIFCILHYLVERRKKILCIA